MCQDQNESVVEPLWQHITQLADTALREGRINPDDSATHEAMARSLGENTATFMETLYDRLKHAQE